MTHKLGQLCSFPSALYTILVKAKLDLGRLAIDPFDCATHVITNTKAYRQDLRPGNRNCNLILGKLASSPGLGQGCSYPWDGCTLRAVAVPQAVCSAKAHKEIQCETTLRPWRMRRYKTLSLSTVSHLSYQPNPLSLQLFP
jgi:hypothetical protein